MGWWKADPVPDEPKATLTASNITSKNTPSQPSAIDTSASACPVDPKTRQIWLQQAQQKSQAVTGSELPTNHPPTQSKSRPAATQKFVAAPSQECSSDRIDQSMPSPATSTSTNGRRLSVDREVSSIPRAYPFEPAGKTNIPSNAEAETGHDKTSGNWIYPSETQFFNAVMRKHPEATSPADLASSISSIIPIHNAVNERAWSMIRRWESDQPSNKSCNGPKLMRFEGKGAGAKSPRAIMKSWSGYQEPFDRHDWTIQRCDGTEVEYVIDFYQGKSPAGQVTGASAGAPASGMGGINFYLDVRPKLNSFEGCRLRFGKFLGWT